MNAASLDSLEVFCGKVSDNRAEVYVRLSGQRAASGPSLSGHVRGPFCESQRTLPTTAPLQDLGPGPAMLAHATVIDPCGWSTLVPAWYEVQVEVRDSARVVERVQRELGIRRFGGRGKSLYWDAKRWVLRAVGCREPSQETLTDCRDCAAALLTQQPNDRLCQQASRAGVMVVPQLRGSSREVEAQLRRVARWACVGLVIVQPEDQTEVDFSAAAPNVVLAAVLTQTVDPLASWAGAVVCADVQLAEARGLHGIQHELPVIASRRYDEAGGVRQRRAECDRLQRDLSVFGDLAGYVVM